VFSQPLVTKIYANISKISSTFIYLLRVAVQSAKENTGPERTE